MSRNKYKPISFRKPTSYLNLVKKSITYSLIATTILFSHHYVPQGIALADMVTQPLREIPVAYASVLNVDYERTVRITDNIRMPMAESIFQKILDLNKKSETEPIVMIIESPGGDILAGHKILDAMALSKAPIHAQVIGVCASMAAIIAVHADRIYALPSAWFLFHNALFGTRMNDMREVKRWLAFFDKYMDSMNKSTAHKLNMTLKEYKEKISSTWILTSKEMLKNGYIDGYITDITCETSKKECKEKIYKPFNNSNQFFN